MEWASTEVLKAATATHICHVHEDDDGDEWTTELFDGLTL